MNETKIHNSCVEMAKEPRLFPDNFLIEFGKNAWIYDIEIYPNYSLFMFRSADPEVQDFAISLNDGDDCKRLDWMLSWMQDKKPTLIGFNNEHYDDTIIKFISWSRSDRQRVSVWENGGYKKRTVPKEIEKVTCEDLYHLSQIIILGKADQTVAQRKTMSHLQFNVFMPSGKTIDIRRMFFYQKTSYKSLKELGVSLGMKWVQDLPYPFDQPLTDEQKKHVFTYCKNDLSTTAAVFNFFKPQIESLERINKRCNNEIDVQGKNEVSASLDWILHLYCKKVGIRRKDIKPIIPEEIHVKDITPDIPFKTRKYREISEFVRSKTLHLKKDELDSGRHKYDYFSKKQVAEYIKRPLEYTQMFGEDFEHCAPIQVTGGVGGGHSNDMAERILLKAGQHMSAEDVISYYPSLIEVLQIVPRHMTKEILKIYIDIKNERIAVKSKLASPLVEDREKKKLKQLSNILKLPLNGYFGKLLSSLSPIFCPASGYSITISGQLYMLYLIEKMQMRGITVISFNTDGIDILHDESKLRDVEKCKQEWQEETGLVLENTNYVKMYKHDVNNYVAVTDKGELKKVGLFRDSVDLRKKNEALVVKKAVNNFILLGEDYTEFIKNHDNLNDFMYYYKCTSAFKSFRRIDGEKEYLQKVVRWYKTTDKLPSICRERIALVNTVHANIGDEAKIANSENGKITQILPEEFPTDIDYDHYIVEVESILKRCESAEKVRALEEKRKELRGMGLCPFPKQGKKNPIGLKNVPAINNMSFLRNSGKPLANSHNGYYETIGIFTGVHKDHDTEICVFDIDDPHLCRDLLELIFKHETMFVYSGGDKMRFKAIYHTKNTHKRFRMSASKTKKKGFEFFYGNPVSIFGTYEFGNEERKYEFENKPMYLSKELEDYILPLLPPIRKKKIVTNAQETLEIIRSLGDPAGNQEQQNNWSQDLDRLNSSVQQFMDETGIDLVFVPRDDSEFKYVGRCPFGELHDAPSHNEEFDITIKPNEPMPHFGCYHRSCAPEVAKLREQYYTMWRSARISEIQQEVVESVQITEEAKEKQPVTVQALSEVFDHDAKAILGIAPTGSGKTYMSAMRIIESCKKRLPIVYVAANKLEMRQVREIILHLVGSEKNYKNLFIQNLEACERTDDDKDQDKTAIGKHTLAVITHHSYFLRKGDFSDLYYSILNWIHNKDDVTLIIDEVDTYIEKSTYSIQIGNRYLKRKRQGIEEPVFVRQNNCPAYKKNGKCENCLYSSKNQYLDISAYNLPTIASRGRVVEKELEIGQSLEVPEFTISDELEVDSKGNDGNYKTSYKNIDTHEGYLESKTYRFKLEDGENYDQKAIFCDLVNTAQYATISKEFPSFNGGRITREQILELSESDREKVSYPHSVCDTPRVNCRDKSVLNYLKAHCEKIILLTATISKSAHKFLEETLDVETFNIENVGHGIDNLAIIGTNGMIPFVKNKKVFTSGFEKYGEVLIFQTTAEKANNLFRKIPNDFPVGLYRENSVLREDKFVKGDIKTIITNSRGALGRGISLEDVRVTVANSLAIKPNICFLLSSLSVDEIEEYQEDERIQTIEQNLGRSMRGTGNKVHIVYNTTQEELDELAKRFRKLVKGDIKTYFLSSPEKIKEVAEFFLEEKDIDVQEKDSPEFNFEWITGQMDPGKFKNWTEFSRKINVEKQLRKIKTKEERQNQKKRLRDAFDTLRRKQLGK